MIIAERVKASSFVLEPPKKVNVVCLYYYFSGSGAARASIPAPAAREPRGVSGRAIACVAGGWGAGRRRAWRGRGGISSNPRDGYNGRAQKVSEMLRRGGGAPAQSRSHAFPAPLRARGHPVLIFINSGWAIQSPEAHDSGPEQRRQRVFRRLFFLIVNSPLKGTVRRHPCT